MRQEGPNRLIEMTAWFLSVTALVVAIGIRFVSQGPLHDLVSQVPSQDGIAHLPSLRFLRLQIQIAEQQEFLVRQDAMIDSPEVALAFVNRWVGQGEIPEDQREVVQQACEVLREGTLPDRYRAFCLARLNESSDLDLLMLAGELAAFWNVSREF